MIFDYDQIISTCDLLLKLFVHVVLDWTVD